MPTFTGAESDRADSDRADSWRRHHGSPRCPPTLRKRRSSPPARWRCPRASRTAAKPVSNTPDAHVNFDTKLLHGSQLRCIDPPRPWQEGFCRCGFRGILSGIIRAWNRSWSHDALLTPCLIFCRRSILCAPSRPWRGISASPRPRTSFASPPLRSAIRSVLLRNILTPSCFVGRAALSPSLPAGAILLQEIREAFVRLRNATSQLRRRVVTGSLTIGAPPSFAAKWLLPRLPRLGEACPEIEVRIVCASELVDFGSHRGRNPPRQR